MKKVALTELKDDLSIGGAVIRNPLSKFVVWDASNFDVSGLTLTVIGCFGAADFGVYIWVAIARVDTNRFSKVIAYWL